MGIIQKTRDNSALMLIVIGGALLAFILTEYLSTNNSSNELDTTVGEFNGVEISDQEFAAEREKLVFLTDRGKSFNSTLQKGQVTNQTWNSILRDKFYENETEELGIKVTGEEEEEMLIGNSETKTQPFYFFVDYLFGGRQKYIENREKIAQNPSDISEHAYMAVFDNNRNVIGQVRLDRGKDIWVRDFGIKLKEQEKLTKLLSSCFYTTTSLAKDEFVAINSNKDIEVGFVKYSSIDNESTEPTEEEIKAAYEKLKYQFIEKENSRKLVFATFDLKPSAEDKQSVLEDIAGLKATLNEEEDPKLFIRNETDAEDVSDFNFYKRGEYPKKIAGIDTLLFRLKKGDTYGPFTNPDQSKYGIAKVLDVKQLADSAKFEMAYVKVQPVFDRIAKGDSSYKFSAENDQAEIQKLYLELVDSLLEEAQSKKLSALSKDLISIDSTYIKDNKLQWAQLSVNNLGKNFMDTIVTSKIGDVKKVFIPTQQGGVYAIIKVKKFGVKSRKMQIGTIIKSVYPGDKTQEDYMSRANQVAFAIKEGKDLALFSDSLKFNLDSANVKGSTYTLKNITDSRKIIYWAFNTEFNEPSAVFTTPEKYVVGVVKSENNTKYTSLDDPYVKYVCETHARKEKQKATILNNFPELNENNLQSLADAYDAITITKESSVNLKKGSSQFSKESEVNGNIAGLSKDKTSNIIEGEDGVYVVRVLNENSAKITENTTFDNEKNQLQYAAQRNGNLLVNEYITEKADLRDNRKILR